jgi:hypothetical protein
MSFKDSVSGAMRSITVWAAAVIGILANVAPYVPDLCAALGLHPATTQRVGSVVAVIMLMLRAITTQSLAAKGAAAAAVPPVTSNQKGFVLMSRTTPLFLPVLMLLGAIAVLMTLPGCALVSKLESPAAQPFDQVAVAAGVDAIVMQGATPTVQAARAASIKAIATEVLAADTGTTATLATLESVAQAKVTALALPPGDAAAAALLIASLDAAINTYAGKLTGNAQVAQVQTAVATVLGWVISECNHYIPTAAVIPPAGGGLAATVASFPVVVRRYGRAVYRA